MENCVIYPRFSSHGQNEQSIEAQIRICKEFAKSKGLNVVNIYPEKAKTGTNDNRPAFQRMIADAQSGAFQYIIVYMMDRFARNRRDSILYKEMLKEKYGIRVLSALEPITDDEGGEFYEMFLEWNAEKYSKRLSKRVRDGLDTNVEEGLYCGGILLFGYRLNTEPVPGKTNKFVKRIAVNDDEASVVRFIFESYDKGVSKKDIAAELNRQGHRLKGKPFTNKVFDNWLLNEKYTGEFTFGGRRCSNMYPKIIDKALFERVQNRLRKNKYVAGGMATAKIPYLLTGKLFCGHCGTDMVSDGGTSRNGVKHYYYACKKKKKGECDKKREDKDSLEKYVTACITDFLSNKNNAEIVVSDVLNYYEKRTDEQNLKSVRLKIANLRKDADRLADAFVKAKSELLRESIEKRMREYELLLDDLCSQKAQLELERGYRLTKNDLLDFISELLKGDIHDKEYQRKIIDHLVSRVFISDDHTVVYFNIKGGKNINSVSFDDTKSALLDPNRVQSQSPLPCHCRPNPNTIGIRSFLLFRNRV